MLTTLVCLAFVRQNTGAPWMLGPFAREDAANPVLKPDPRASFFCPMRRSTVTWESDNVFNPAAVVRNGKMVVLFRAEDHSGEGIGEHTSRIGYAQSSDGLHFSRRGAPVLFPEDDQQKSYDWPGGCEDPRVVQTPGGYLLMYTSWNKKLARLSCATSPDLIHWTKRGPAFAKANGGRFLDTWSKSGSVVTEMQGDHLVAARIRGEYWMYYGEGSIHLAHSTNLTDWDPVLDSTGQPVEILGPRPRKFDSALAEAGPPAVLTSSGIVLIYNGKNDEKDGAAEIDPGAYSAGQALMDSADLTHVIGRTDSPFLFPDRPYEKTGQYRSGTVFMEGLASFHGKWWLYYGTADSKVAVATAPEKSSQNR